MTPPDFDADRFEPRSAGLIAALVCVLAALTLLWPLLGGQILFGGARSDMFIAGYSFRLFGAQEFKATGAIPQWNPYLFGGLPYIAAMHGDIFYPTAWLRWIMPVDLAITWGMAVHFVLAGWLTYGFARALRLSWTASLMAGVAYELTGIVASQMSPGHDGKLFVSALTPLAFWALLHAIRGGRRWAFGGFALVTALVVLGHYLMCYFLLIALGLWTLYLVFWDPERRTDSKPWLSLLLAGLAVVVGIGIAALQVVPFLQYIQYSPRADGGPSTGWAWATSYAMPPSEIFTLILPQFNGVLDHYWGQNPIKFHTEYVGVIPLILACFAWGDVGRRRLVIALTLGALLFLLFAFAGYTPFYRPFFEFVPMLKKIRAMGMVFFLVAFPLALLAGIGLDRVLARKVAPRTLLYLAGGIAGFALLGVIGVLQPFAEGIASQQRMAEVQANAPFLKAGALRLLVFVALTGGLLWAIAAERLKPALATALLLTLTAADLWSVDRQFYQFSPRAAQLFGQDDVTKYLAKIKPPYRLWDAQESYGHSVLMAYRIPNALGYHGNELRYYDELVGKDHDFKNLVTPNLFDLLALRFLVLRQLQSVPGFHGVIGPVSTAFGTSAVLYERDSLPPYARVIPSAAKVPEAQVVPTLVDPRFPVRQVILFPDTASIVPDSLRQPLVSSTVQASVTEWAPGRMTVLLQGTDPAMGHLLISENWFPDWGATVDGKPGVVRRGDHSLLSVDLPSGAREVRLRYDSRSYAEGKMITLLSLLAACGMLIAPLLFERTRARA